MPTTHPVRVATDDDLSAAARVRARANPDRIVSAEGMRLVFGDPPRRAVQLQLAVDVDGELAGWAVVMRVWFQTDPEVGMLDVVVDPDHEGHGIGSSLAARAEEHLRRHGLRTVRSSSLDAPAHRRFATGLGFVETSASSTSSVDPRTVVPDPVPDGVRLVSFGALDDPTPVYELDLETSRDIPGEENFDGMTLADWTKRFWRSPFADDEASLVAYVDGRVAAMTMLRVDRPSGRAQNNLTATRREFRGRGLARLLKSHSLHAAAGAGATVSITDNDETNARMLAVNAALGYRPFARRVEWERRSASDPRSRAE
jgi:GNAT superfamily N-acetyltransferase